MADKLKKGEACDGEEMLTMTLDELRDKIFHEWLETEKTDYHIFRKAILDAKEDSISWKATSPVNTRKKATLRVHFV